MGDKRQNQRQSQRIKQKKAADAASAAREMAAADETARPTGVLDVRSFLYVGGRDCQVAHLRQIASDYGADMIHHDGGLREAVSRIDSVLPSVDCVFCPIDCISHDACLRVKTGCKKFGKTFVPLRNGSKSSLERALADIKAARPRTN